jgi:hypothetical protein
MRRSLHTPLRSALETTFVKGKVCMFTKISQMPKGSRLFFNSYGATWIVFANKA